MKRGLGVAILMMGVVGHWSVVAARSAGGADDVPVTVDVAWAIVDDCVEDPPRTPESARDFLTIWPRRMACAEGAGKVANAGTDADRERLWSVLDALPDNTPFTADVVDAFLDHRVEIALAATGGRSRPARIEPVASDSKMPAPLRAGPPALQEAWRLYESALAFQEKALEWPSANDAIVFHSNEAAFRRTIVGFLRGRVSPAEAVAELSRYQWGGGCGTGSEALFVPRAKVMLAAYLQLDRADLALAAGGELDGRYGRGVEGLGTGSDPRLLAAAGIDWERYDLGAVLDGRLDLAVPLALRGSEKTVRLLLEAVTLFEEDVVEPPEGFVESLLFPVAAVVEPEAGNNAPLGRDSREIGPRDTEAERLPADVQQRALDLLADHVRPAAGRPEAETASRLLVKLGRMESRDAFRTMLGSPYDEVRRHGVIGLRALGDSLPDAERSRPVVFRFLVDGRPAADRALEFWLDTEDAGGESGGIRTDSAGLASLDHDRFVDPRRKVSLVRFQQDPPSPAGQWFDVAVEPPQDLDAVTTVSVRTGALTVIIPPELLGYAASTPPTLMLLAVREGDGSDGPSLRSASPEIQVRSSRMRFPHLQHGRYEAWLSRDSTHYTSPVVEVGDQPVTVGLEPDYSPDADEPADDRAAKPTNQPL